MLLSKHNIFKSYSSILSMKDQFVKCQCIEITEYLIYDKLAHTTKDPHNKKILKHIAQDEKRHAEFWKKKTGIEVKPNKIKYYWYIFLARLLGLTFALKLMEKGEGHAQRTYETLCAIDKQTANLIKDEQKHEQELINMLEEEKLAYAGSIVLGLNDALVELTGALAGFTLALQNGSLIAITGLITGFAASLSMAASGYLQSKEEEQEGKNPIKSAIYTGVAYLITVVFLVGPYFIFSNVYHALTATLSVAILIIFAFTYYISIAKDLSFWPRFNRMAAISLGVAALSFGVGIVLKKFIGV